MTPFISEDFLLFSKPARRLYHEVARDLPIIDYHSHLRDDLLAQDYQFRDLAEIWLGGDHYKWRALRAHGIDEFYITGAATPWEKFSKWVETVPFIMRNPLYHWSHLELVRYFDINLVIKPEHATEIWETCNALLATKEFSARALLRRMRVELVCTTDDPCSLLEHHRKLKEEGYEVKVLPTFRPDKALCIDQPMAWNQWVDQLAQVTERDIRHYDQFLAALTERHDYFAAMGCRLSDHGLQVMPYADFDKAALQRIFASARKGHSVSIEEQERFRTGLLYELALLDHQKNWTAQWHLGAMRNNSSRLFSLLGPDAGADSIGEDGSAAGLAQFLNRLDRESALSKTILYNLNPAMNTSFATMTGNFQDGSIPGKIQWGSAWWFLDNYDGMREQLNVLSQTGLLSHFVGMLTDSRSFLSFPRHEYFRRILCNLIGEDLEMGMIPSTEWLQVSRMVEGICYTNARSYFGFP